MDKKPFLALIKFLVRTLTQFEIVNYDLIPQTGGALITTNHLSRLDTPLLLTLTERKDLVAIVAKKYEKKLFFKWILERIGIMVWMDRSRIDFAALREALDYLRRGAMVGLAPEGTRSRDANGLLEGKQGAALLVSEMDRNDRQVWLARNTDEIMCRIAALLPPEYRGFYAQHPRLLELLSESTATDE